MWMQIGSFPVKFAFTFAFIYLTCVMLQTWDLSIGPFDPTPPAEWPLAQRAMWFTMFTGGGFFIYYMVAASLLIPVMRIIVRPLHLLPTVAAALMALVLGAAAGLGVLALVTSASIDRFAQAIGTAYDENPLFIIGYTLASVVAPAILGARLGSRRSKGD